MLDVLLSGVGAKGRAPTGHQSHNAGTHTWLTPPEILAALGSFDLDPCACPEPRPWVTAAVMWTRADAPLSRAWPAGARAWVNPPFAPKELLAAFIARLADHGRGTALLFARTDTALWHEHVFGRADAVLFLKGRPNFHRQNGSRAALNSGAPVALAAYGPGDAGKLATCGLPGRFVDG